MPKTTLKSQKASEMRSWVPWDVKVGSLEHHMAPWDRFGECWVLSRPSPADPAGPPRKGRGEVGFVSSDT